MERSGEDRPRHALVFGGSGQIGERVLAGLLAAGWQVTAVSRASRAVAPGLIWRLGDLSGAWQEPASFDAVFSCGPLDHFARWYAASDVGAARVVAFGSTSVEVKGDSSEAAERDVARRLREAEATLFAAARERGAAATVLRPTLVYGAGRDATLSAIAALASRTGLFVLPSGADGLRQPVHVQDLADAALQVPRHRPRPGGPTRWAAARCWAMPRWCGGCWPRCARDRACCACRRHCSGPRWRWRTPPAACAA